MALDFLSIANTKAAASLAQGLGEALGGGSGPIQSGGQTDARSFMDGSGWVVSTGSSKATGGDRTQGEAWGPSTTANTPQPLQAGMGVGGGLLLLVFAGMVYRSRTA